MTQSRTARRPGIPTWVWILVLLAVVAVLWWIFADPGTGAPALEETGRRPAPEAPATAGVPAGGPVAQTVAAPAPPTAVAA